MRMAPKEAPVCDVLGENLETWEDKALHMLDIIKDYQCISIFYDPLILSDEQKQLVLKRLKKPEDDTNPDNDFEMPLTIQELYDKVATNSDT
jgi:hypothetical protein